MGINGQQPRLFSREPDPARPLQVFISYSREDEIWKDRLIGALSGLRRDGKIALWHDMEALPGSDWEKKILFELDAADIVLLLVSASFLKSEICYQVEFTRALERQQEGGLVVVPVPTRPCDWPAKIAAINGIPFKSKPLHGGWPNEDDGLTFAASRLRRLVDAIQAARSGTGPIPGEITGAALGVEADPVATPTVTIVKAKIGGSGLHLPFLLDRSDQLVRLFRRIRAAREHMPGAPFVMILEGDEQQGHSAFVKRLQSDFFPSEPEFGGTPYCPPAIEWPGPDDAPGLEIFGPLLAKSMSLPMSSSKAQIQRHIASHEGATVFHTEILAQDWGPGSERLLSEWLRLWNDWMDGATPQRNLLIVVVSVKYAREAHPNNDALRKSITEALASGLGRIHCYRAEPALGDVHKKHRDAWIEHDRVQALGQPAVVKLERKSRPVFPPGVSLPMQEAIDKLGDILDEIEEEA